MLQTTAIGYLGQDATIKEVNGKSVTNFSIAHSEKYKNAAGTVVEKTTWLECSHWDAEKVSPYLKKGTQIYVVGQPDARAWKNKNDEPVATLHLRVQRLELLGGVKPTSEAHTAEKQTPSTTKEDALQSAQMVNDDLPF